MSLQQRKIFSSLILFQGEKCRGSFSISFYSGGGGGGGDLIFQLSISSHSFNSARAGTVFHTGKNGAKVQRLVGYLSCSPSVDLTGGKSSFLFFYPPWLQVPSTYQNPTCSPHYTSRTQILTSFGGKTTVFYPPPPLYVSSHGISTGLNLID